MSRELQDHEVTRVHLGPQELQVQRVQKARRDLLVCKVSEGRKVKWAHLDSLDHWGCRALQDHRESQDPLDPEAPRVYLERSASRENLGSLGRRGRLERMG